MTNRQPPKTDQKPASLLLPLHPTIPALQKAAKTAGPATSASAERKPSSAKAQRTPKSFL